MSILQSKFEQFHTTNPHVYSKLVELAKTLKASGKKTYSINSLFERLRWHFDIETKGDPFRLNNNYRSRYVRLIMTNEPDLASFFNTRTLMV